jgi:murein DD-endopeptidase MepM/ murein hydrolase activator NlpD
VAALGTAGLALTSLVVSTAEASASPRDRFQMPFLCGAQWNGATYSGHGLGDEGLALDFNKGSGNDDLGRPVAASAAGTVIVRTGSAIYGKQVFIKHGGGWRTMYAHLKDITVRNGQQVARGKMIGHVGRTGNAATSHLHYEQLKYNSDGDGVGFEAMNIWFNGAPLNPGYSFTYNGPLYTSRNC